MKNKASKILNFVLLFAAVLTAVIVYFFKDGGMVF